MWVGVPGLAPPGRDIKGSAVVRSPENRSDGGEESCGYSESRSVEPPANRSREAEPATSAKAARACVRACISLQDKASTGTAEWFACVQNPFMRGEANKFARRSQKQNFAPTAQQNKWIFQGAPGPTPRILLLIHLSTEEFLLCVS